MHQALRVTLESVCIVRKKYKKRNTALYIGRVKSSVNQSRPVEVNWSQLTVSEELERLNCKELVVEWLVALNCKQWVTNRVVRVNPYREIIRTSNRHSHILIIHFISHQLCKSHYCTINHIFYMPKYLKYIIELK